MFDGLFYRRRRRFTKFDFYILVAVAIYFVFKERPDNMWLYIVLIGVTLVCTIYVYLAKRGLTKNSIINPSTRVPAQFIKDKNTLGNINCVAKYFPTQQKIIVMDHPESKIKSELRSFEVSKENVGNVDKVWFDICSVFDEYTYLETLFSYIDKNSGVLRIKYINRTKRDTSNDATVGYEEYKNPKPVYKESALVIDEYGDPLINIENLEKKEIKANNNKKDFDNFVEMNDILKSEDGKIDLNIADAEKLAKLPGINIIKAKKIVEYRNKNGFFKTKEDFYQIAGIKDHFIEKIENLITVDKTSKAIVEPRKKITERIVDY